MGVIDEPPLTNVDDFLMHYGVKGMKWDKDKQAVEVDAEVITAPKHTGFLGLGYEPSKSMSDKTREAWKKKIAKRLKQKAWDNSVTVYDKHRNYIGRATKQGNINRFVDKVSANFDQHRYDKAGRGYTKQGKVGKFVDSMFKKNKKG